MSLAQSPFVQSYPRSQAQLFAELLTREASAFRGAVVGKRRAGKTDLLQQVFALLFQKAEGPVPFWYAFEQGKEEESLARHFAAAFCRQARAFLMRQEDFLGEPPVALEKELERPGLPLCLTELGRDLLACSTSDRGGFAAALPAQFAHREGRPVCLLLDDAEALSRPAGSPFLSALEAPHLSSLLTGRSPFVLRVAGRRCWPLVALEPFSREDALALAENKCKQAGLRFYRQAWEDWLEVAGASPGWIHGLIEAALITEQSLDSIEALGRVYLRDLTEGTLGNWLTGRWHQAFPDRQERARVAGQLASLARGGTPAAATPFPPAIWDGLIAEEWAEEGALAPVVKLGMVERDWLDLATSMTTISLEQARAKALQAFLLKAEEARQRRGFFEAVPAGAVAEVRTQERRIRLSELEARAQWLEEELLAAREQFQQEMGKAAVAEAGPRERGVPIPAGSPGSRQELYWRMAVSLSLALVSTDLLAANLQSNPAMLGALKDIQAQSQRLLEVLRGYERKGSTKDSPEEGGSPPASPL